MASHVRWGRWIRIAAIAILAPVVCLIAIVRIQQYILRWRAERLLADIRQIQMGKSTWADAQRLMYRWGKWGMWEGECSSKKCDYQIAMEDFCHAFPIHIFPQAEIREEARPYCAALYRPYYLLGGRFASIVARVGVKNGIIWTKSYSAAIDTFTRSPDSKESISYVLIGDAIGMTSFRFDYRPRLFKHPEYFVGRPSGCESRDDLYAHFSPFADPAIVDQLLDFNLACLTQLLACKYASELMPSVWRLYNQPDSNERQIKEEQPLEIAARDNYFVAIAEVTAVRSSQELYGKQKWIRFRILESLKNVVPVDSAIYDWKPVGEYEFINWGNRKLAELKKGDRILVFFAAHTDRPEPPNPQTELDDLSIYSQCNLEAVKRGIARDALANVP